MSTARCAIVLLFATACAHPVVHYAKSPDRKHTVRVVEALGKQYVERDGESDEIGYRAIGIQSLTFSEDGKHLAYAALTDKGWVVVADGVKQPGRWPGIGELVWSADGTHLSYAVQEGRTWQVVQDGRPGPKYRSLDTGSLRYAGARLIYIAEDRAGRHLVRGTEVSEAFDVISSVVSEDDRIAFIGVTGRDVYAVIDGKKSERYDEVTALSLSAGHRAYFARINEKWIAVIDDKKSAEYDALDQLQLTHDHTAFAAVRGEQAFAVLDGTELEPHERINGLCFAGEKLIVANEHMHALICGGPHHAYVDASQRAVIDGVAGRTYAAISELVLDGDHYAYVALTAQKTSMVVYDGIETAVENPLRGSLVLARDHWACLSALVKTRDLWIIIDGARTERFDLEELVAHKLAKHQTDHNTIKAWLGAEIIRREDQLSRPRAPHPQ